MAYKINNFNQSQEIKTFPSVKRKMSKAQSIV